MMEKRVQEVKSIYSKIKGVFNSFLLGEIKKTKGEVFEVFNIKGIKKGEVELGKDGVLRYFINNEYNGLIFLLINKEMVKRKIEEQLSN